MLTNLTSKQILSIAEAKAFINIWEGSIRSGKTYASIIAFANFVSSAPPGEIMIVGSTAESIERNVIRPFEEIYRGYTSWSPGKRILTVCNRAIWVVGAPDSAAYMKIHGSTLITAYVDELSLIPQSFFETLIGRLSLKGARLFATTNPDSPYHWLKLKLDQSDGKYLKSFHFDLTDNPYLPKDYLENIKRSYTGLYYKRYLEGKWVLAEGSVYDFFTEKEHCIEYPPSHPASYIVGIDYGTANPCAFVLMGYNPAYYPNLWVENEYYWDSKKMLRQKTDLEYANDFKKFIQNKPIKAIYVDPSAASFKLELSKQGVQNLFDAKNEVEDGIRTVSNCLNQGMLRIAKNCHNLIREFQSYVWDSKSQKTGKDRPLKENDHALDALRYALYTHFFNKSDTKIDWDKEWREVMGTDHNLPPMFQNTNVMPYLGAH